MAGNNKEAILRDLLELLEYIENTKKDNIWDYLNMLSSFII